MNEVYKDAEKYIPELRRYARALAHNPVAADDLVQECMVRALTKSHLYRSGTNLRAWLFTILHNHFISQMRRQGSMEHPVDPDTIDHRSTTLANQEDRILLRSLQRAMNQLPRQQRQLIEKASLGGESYDDLAGSMDLPVGTIKSKISRGRERLRADLRGKIRTQQSRRQRMGGT